MVVEIWSVEVVERAYPSPLGLGCLDIGYITSSLGKFGFLDHGGTKLRTNRPIAVIKQPRQPPEQQVVAFESFISMKKQQQQQQQKP